MNSSSLSTNYIGRLTDGHVPGFVDLAIAVADEEDRIARIAGFREKLAANDESVRNIVVIADEGGRVIAASRILPLGEKTFTLGGFLFADGIVPGEAEFAGLIGKMLERAREVEAREVGTQLTAEQSSDGLLKALRSYGFERVGERIEFRAMLDDLPSDEGSPIEWRSMEELGLPFAASILLTSSKGDPHSSDDEDPVEAINEWLTDEVLTTSADCVQIGYVGAEPVAFICAQVRPSNGWSRIAYMGVVPQARGRGLGRWVHRHGFAMLRRQGGKLYHGGTAADNAPMLALFASHGCREFVRGTEWRWRGE
jgi:GNAT superfamily N-acetyltransferase